MKVCNFVSNKNELLTKSLKKMKTLILVAHPQIENSIINKRWIEELMKYPDTIYVHQIYKEYPDENIDVEKEQKLVEKYDNLILQFPMYWFNCTPLLKKWMDKVLIYGWAYGSKGNKLKEKKISIAVSIGLNEDKFSKFWDSETNIIDQILSPFKAAFTYTKSDFRPCFKFFGTNEATREQIEEKAKEYIDFIQAP